MTPSGCCHCLSSEFLPVHHLSNVELLACTSRASIFIPRPTEIIRAERLNVRDVSTNSASLHWRPVLTGLRGHYEVRFAPLPTKVPSGGGGGDTGTSPSTGGSQYQRLVESAASSTVRLTGLKPDTTYTVTLIPESNEHTFNALTTTFTTKPGWITFFFSNWTITLILYLICA